MDGDETWHGSESYNNKLDLSSVHLAARCEQDQEMNPVQQQDLPPVTFCADIESVNLTELS